VFWSLRLWGVLEFIALHLSFIIHCVTSIIYYSLGIIIISIIFIVVCLSSVVHHLTGWGDLGSSILRERRDFRKRSLRTIGKTLLILVGVGWRRLIVIVDF